ncbi:RHOMBOID 1 [Olea europaea subsp. europaea]|uniref:RHOMBOID 1 n=1 Tax=Olea europaea subsp. europaea TaxID=158383 RepID=A0A8S0S0T7_OLEEU|nr:RHOMBOID 1 [Olea europaea subsp. europaea]
MHSLGPFFDPCRCRTQIVSLRLKICVEFGRFTVGLILLLRGVDLNDHCSWCHYLSCVPTSMWSCNTQPVSCMVRKCEFTFSFYAFNCICIISQKILMSEQNQVDNYGSKLIHTPERRIFTPEREYCF